jgi:hypothetical protein
MTIQWFGVADTAAASQLLHTIGAALQPVLDGQKRTVFVQGLRMCRSICALHPHRLHCLV